MEHARIAKKQQSDAATSLQVRFCTNSVYFRVNQETFVSQLPTFKWSAVCLQPGLTRSTTLGFGVNVAHAPGSSAAALKRNAIPQKAGEPVYRAHHARGPPPRHPAGGLCPASAGRATAAASRQRMDLRFLKTDRGKLQIWC
jgi:hypothetical protein